MPLKTDDYLYCYIIAACEFINGFSTHSSRYGPLLYINQSFKLSSYAMCSKHCFRHNYFLLYMEILQKKQSVFMMLPMLFLTKLILWDQHILCIKDLLHKSLQKPRFLNFFLENDLPEFRETKIITKKKIKKSSRCNALA